MDMHKELKRWEQKADSSLQAQLKSYEKDEKALKDAFYSSLVFGTGGLRGIIGAGPNRMNIHTVGQATQGLANYLNKKFDQPSVSIARDSRNMGDVFCKIAARVLAANKIKVFLYPRIEPTPALSFAVRDLHTSAGICMTASHNPSIYNGYKVYGPDGCQITTKAAQDIQNEISFVDMFDNVSTIDFESALDNGYISYIGDDTLERYIDACVNALPYKSSEPLKLVYTPLHGSGLECVSAILKRIDINDVTIDPVQKNPDGNFPTCPYPNPEFREALEHSLELCEQVQPDLLIATDPDSDRVGVAINNDGKFELLTGNEVGVLLCDYLMQIYSSSSESSMPDSSTGSSSNATSDKVVITTIVSSCMIDALASRYNFEVRRTLTGFKFIGEQIAHLESHNQVHRYAFGFEESYGYLVGTHVRDKDAVVSTALICEMARWYRAQNKNLIQAMEALYERDGYYHNDMVNIEYPGADGSETMTSLMKSLRDNPPTSFAGLKVKRCVDYSTGVPMPLLNQSDKYSRCGDIQKLPKSNVLQFDLENNNRIIIRPSGTEPKIKAYLFSKASTEDEAVAITDKLKTSATDLLS